MNQLAQELLVAFEVHSPARIRGVLAQGISASAPLEGKTPMQWLTEMYTRSERFPDCVRALLEQGATLADAALEAVLLNDGAALAAALRSNPALMEQRATLVSAFTPLIGATLLHVAVEYGQFSATRTLIEHGADVNARAAVDAHGLGGHTPIFHAVNSHANRSAPLLERLLEAGARTEVFVEGLVWGRGFDWATTLFDLTPLSYAQCGLLPQFHREEQHVLAVQRTLLRAAGRSIPPLENVPNRYVAAGKRT